MLCVGPQPQPRPLRLVAQLTQEAVHKRDEALGEILENTKVGWNGGKEKGEASKQHILPMKPNISGIFGGFGDDQTSSDDTVDGSEIR